MGKVIASASMSLDGFIAKNDHIAVVSKIEALPGGGSAGPRPKSA